ncbi:glycerophosphodiester phosphodiesterase family protein [Luteolibacter flavescens]|uniref:Glycerophosphodiester phosphodiesterase family protein n=1 Tax=Luteolibacter flavescens TaxID=1859460 RepID=A0ABT3FI96_9BACT|nr:glycerophosphodiester phosphodiesterase family protein [Luteolibacter flavescens]MCW1883284.1 glycerophosphodiester phosphodiesterase family protein [Luteolibacter flavescens]
MNLGFFPALKSAAFLSLVLAGTAMADIAPVLASYRNSEDKRVLVACHRAGYLVKGGKDLPENSLLAIRDSIRAGAEILEIDLMMTSDGELVLMHDTTLDRTTSGKGKVRDKTLAEIKELHLLLPDRKPTEERVPTFRETMEAVKGKVLVNLDKLPVTDRKKMDAAMKVLRETGTVDHAIFKQGVKDVPAEKIRKALERYPEKLDFMPVIANATSQEVVAVLDTYRPEAIEIVFKDEPVGMLSPEVLAAAKRHGTRLWINTLWASLNAGRDDARALAGDPAGSWGWVVERGAAIIQTDHRDPLLRYLEGLGKRQAAK